MNGLSQDALIYDVIRTPRGKARVDGGLYDLSPLELLASLYRALVDRNNFDPALIGDVILGNVTQYGEQAGNLAKSSTLYAGWPSTVAGMTLTRFCSSGLDAISVAAMKVMVGQEDVTIGGGIEMMSRVPMMSDEATIFRDPATATAA